MFCVSPLSSCSSPPPSLQGSSNSVETTDETELFHYMLENKLITLGWIHTHPKQVHGWPNPNPIALAILVSGCFPPLCRDRKGVSVSDEGRVQRSNGLFGPSRSIGVRTIPFVCVDFRDNVYLL